MIDPEDLAPLDRDKGLAALSRVRLAEVTDPEGPDFAGAYAALDSFFGPLGELEARATLAEFVRRRRLVFSDDAEGTYHLVVAKAGEEIVGVRDCYVYLDLRAGSCVVALSHSYVAPEWRRSGVAALLRAVPVALARRLWAAQGPMPTLLVTEMEPADPARPETVVRLISYGRAGFGALDPSRFRYAQPDFRALSGAAHTGIALLGVIRPFHVPPGPLPVAVVASFPRLFYLCHRGFLPAERVDPSERFTGEVLAASDAPVPLLPLPTGADTLERLAPLVRGAVLPLHPPGLRGEDPRFGDPGEELAQIVAAWRRG